MTEGDLPAACNDRRRPRRDPVTCGNCGVVYDQEEAEGCPLCGHGTVGGGVDSDDATDEMGLATRVRQMKHKQVLVEAIEELGQTRMASLYERYSKEVEEPRSRRTIRKYLNQLAKSNAPIVLEGENRGREYYHIETYDNS